MSVLVQVALLAVFAVVASQVVAFTLILTAPPPRPAGFSIAAAADALNGRPAETSDGRALKRRLSNNPPSLQTSSRTETPGPLERAIATGLAQRLGRPADQVRVWLPTPMAQTFSMAGRAASPAGPERITVGGSQTYVFTRREAGASPEAVRETALRELGEILVRRGASADGAEGAASPPPPPPGAGPAEPGVRVIASTDRQTRFAITAEQLTFAPFSASVRLADGRWATVEPPRGLIDPWQARLLLALAITALLLAPLVWFMARRLTRPIRQFAEAAERLGADPDAEPLTPSGPSEVRTAIGAFNDMQASIRDHMRQRTQTIAAIAHDLRTPLTRLRFRAEQAPDVLRDKMAADVEEMDDLIAQAMAFVRGDSLPERRERLDLAALAADCAEGFTETGARVEFVGPGILPVEGDPASLRRALANLIENAVKFAGAARVSPRIEGATAVVVIADDGPGLPEEELELVFEPFQRGERSRSRRTGGAGLGLAVARQAARAAGGEVTLSNRPGGGLEARLVLPLAS
jgi:two-component system OmpR family sensor kinase